uniref:Uncharacterized protein n=1 Tax=Plectus sambesii TaxID=2011161 RepID=A0A914X3N0_9BILA
MYFRMATSDRASSYFIAASCSDNCYLMHAKCLKLHGSEGPYSGHLKVKDDILTAFGLQVTRHRPYEVCCCSEDGCNSASIRSQFGISNVISIAGACLVVFVLLC